MTPEPLTLAYVAIGAAERWAESPSLVAPASERFGGQVGFIAECIEYAGVLDELWLRYEDAFDGVFAYDIAEPFGDLVARRVLAGDGVVRAEALRIACELYEENCQ